MDINLNALRKALEQECCDAFFIGDFGGAMVQLTEIQAAFPSELIVLAQKMGVNLQKFEISD